MPGRIDARLASLKIELPDAPPPAANYVPFVRTGNMVFISGQVPLVDGKIAHHGVVGGDLSVEQGQEAESAPECT